MNQDELKEKVEKDLLTAMKSIDSAVFTITQELGGNYGQSTQVLLDCKMETKRILNKYFDQLARNKTKTQ